MRELPDVLSEVFGPRWEEFGPELRSRLTQLHREGIKAGLYMERERLPVPPEVFVQWVRPDKPTEDPRETPGRVMELEELQQRVVQNLEKLTIAVEQSTVATRTTGVRGHDLARAREQAKVQLEAWDRQVRRILEQVRAW